MGIYYKILAIFSLIILFLLYNLYYYKILPLIILSKTKTALKDYTMPCFIDLDEIDSTIKNDLYELTLKISCYKKLKPFDFGFIFFEKSKNCYLQLGKNKEITNITKDKNSSNLNFSNKLFNFCKTSINSNIEYNYSSINGRLIVTKRCMLKNSNVLVYIKFPSISQKLGVNSSSASSTSKPK